MDSFWDFVAGLGPIATIAIAVVVIGFVLAWTLGGIADLGQFLTVDAYRAFRYERKGICGICKKPYTRNVNRSADQTYGPDVTTRAVCPNGHVSILRGNRRFADWAGF